MTKIMGGSIFCAAGENFCDSPPIFGEKWVEMGGDTPKSPPIRDGGEQISESSPPIRRTHGGEIFCSPPFPETVGGESKSAPPHRDGGGMPPMNRLR